MIDRDIMHLDPNFRKKVIVLMDVVGMAYKNLHLFEWFRTAARQKLLARTVKWPVAKPGTSYHEKWLAVDRTWLNSKGQPTWNGDYKFLIWIGDMCWMIWVRGESCHLQCNKKTIDQTMKKNSTRYKLAPATEQLWLKRINDCFRKHGYWI